MKTPLKIAISPSHPLLILMAPCGPGGHLAARGYQEEARFMVECWETLDDEIKPYATVQIEGICDDHWRRNEVLLPYAQRAGIPITLQTQTNNSDVNDTVPTEIVRRLVDEYSCIVGLQLAEASQRTFVGHGAGPEYSMGRNARYARDIIRLAGEYGLFMSWQTMSENYAAIGCSADNEALFDAVCEYGEYVIPMHEMNSEFAKYIDHLAAMGLWLSGATANWGVEGQSWYWSDAGYHKPGTCIPGSLEMPGELYAIMFLLGATAGATAYSVEPPWDIWPGPGEWRFREWIVPTFTRLVKERLIPSRGEVMATMPVAYHMPRCEKPLHFHKISEDLDFDHHEGRLIRATYGVFDRARDAEMIPNNPRYGWFPALPTKTPQSVLSQFTRIIRPGDLASVDHAREVMEEHYPPVDRGQAWSQLVGPLVFAANTHENWFVPESVKLSLPRCPDGVRIEPQGKAQVLVWDAHEGDRGYRVWRLREGEETCLTEEPIREPQFTLREVAASDRFAVTAITDARETIEDTLHLHQFVIFSQRESRRSVWVNEAGEAVRRARFAEALPGETPEVLAHETRCAACTLVEDLASPVIAPDDPQRAIKREVMDAMIGWKQAVEAEDVGHILSYYAADYREPDGRTTESVEVAFRLVFRKYMSEQMGRLAREWGSMPGWQYPAFRLFVRKWNAVTPDRAEVETVAQMWAGGGPEMEPSDMFNHPFGRPKTLAMVWKRTADGWRIAETTPPFIRAEDTGVFRFRYQGW